MPSIAVARRVLPPELLRSLLHIFAQGVSGTWLAGGTALAGFYAGHRRSDDLDFFTASESDQIATTLAVKSLVRIGVKLEVITESKQYLDCLAKAESHRFKITSVLDENLFRVGHALAADGIQVVDLDTLFKMKAATLVSRCSEKDLYDLLWLFGRFPERGFGDLVRLAKEVDGESDGESMLASLAGAILSEAACGFSTDPNRHRRAVYGEILGFRDRLMAGLIEFLKNEPVPPLGELVRKLRRIR